MRLDELRLRNGIDDVTRVKLRTGHVNIVRLAGASWSTPDYHFFHYPMGGDGQATTEWHGLDPLTAQAVLNHLTQEGNDEATRTADTAA